MAGSYSNYTTGFADTCMPCPIGSWAGSGADSCQWCSSGLTTASVGSGTVLACVSITGMTVWYAVLVWIVRVDLMFSVCVSYIWFNFAALLVCQIT